MLMDHVGRLRNPLTFDCTPRFAELASAQPAVLARLIGQELGVGAHLYDESPVHDDDQVGVDDGREPVSDDKRGSAAKQVCERSLDQGLAGGIERTGGLIENHKGRGFAQGSGDRQPLLLTLAKLEPSFADHVW